VGQVGRVGRTLIAVGATLLVTALHAQERPLPNRQQFFDTTRANLERSQSRQASYAYRERRRELHTNPFGRLGSGTGTEEFDVTPVPGGGVERRLVARDGKPVTGGETSRTRPRTRTRRSAVEETADVLDLVLDHREHVNGRDVIVVAFTPKAGVQPESREAKLAHLFKGKIFVDEADAEVVRVEATAVDDISYGLGVVARLNKGAQVTLVRERVDADTWLPTSIRFLGDGRAMVFRKLRVDHVIEWFDYRRAPSARTDRE
jgi:hypothetical protein